MKKCIGFAALMMLLVSVSFAFADKAADDKLIVDSIMVRVDAGELSIEQALTLAIEQGVSFSVLVEECKTRGVALSNIVVAAEVAGLTTEATIGKLAEAGVDKADIGAALTMAGKADPGLGYTPPQPAVSVTPVKPVTPNPGGTAETGTVSPSSL